MSVNQREKENLIGDNLLDRSILKTIYYFQLFSYPLTVIELKKWLYDFKEKIRLSKLLIRLDFLVKNKIIKRENSFFYLDKNFSPERLHREKISQDKWNKILFWIKIFSFFPFVRAIFVCNKLAYNNVLDKSDLDLFIITAENKIWIARFFLTGFLKAFGLRPVGSKTKDKICLNFFVDQSRLDLSSVALRDQERQIIDIHLALWLKQMIPIFDPDDLFREFIKVNGWANIFFSNDNNNFCFNRRVKLNFYFLKIKKMFELFLSAGLVNKFLKNYQLKIMPRIIRDLAKMSDNNVVISDSMLKFHLNDKRTEIYQLVCNYNQSLN